MITVAIFVLGVVLGSFVNALVWRLHEQSKPKSKQKLTKIELSIVKGRSMCPNCHHTLAARDLVPLLSWLWLRGRCRYCQKPISPQYPAVELLTGVAFVLAYLLWPLGFNAVGVVQFGFFAVCTVFFVALAVYDIRWFLLPNKLVSPLIALAVLQVAVVALWQQSLADLWQPIAGAGIIFGLFWGLYQISKGQWIGGGDVKLVIALGLIAGSPVRALMVIFFASLFGTLASIPLLFKGRNGLGQHIPFGPYLLLACFVVALFADRIVSWYQHILL